MASNPCHRPIFESSSPTVDGSEILRLPVEVGSLSTSGVFVFPAVGGEDK